MKKCTTKKCWWVTVGGVLVVVFVLWLVFGGKNDTVAFETVEAERANLESIVSVIGVLEPKDRIQLAFPLGGVLGRVFVEENTAIESGTDIARLRDTEAQNRLLEARAMLSQQQAQYLELAAPVRAEQGSVLDAAVEQAIATYDNAYSTALQALQAAYVDIHEAIFENADELFTDTETNSPSFGVTVSYGSNTYNITGTMQEKIELAGMRRDAGTTLAKMEQYAYEQHGEDIRTVVKQAIDDTRTIELFLTRLAEVVYQYQSDDTNAQTVYESLQTAVSTARNSVSAARQALVTAGNTLSSAAATKEKAEQDRLLGIAGATPEALATAQEGVRVAMEQVDVAESMLEDVVLRAPYTGTVTRLDLTVGEVVRPYDIVGEIVSNNIPFIEVYIPEADIRDVVAGNIAHVTFDSFDRDEVFTARVTAVATTETVREGVPTYKTTLEITAFPQRGTFVLRPGMTADIDIVTNERTNVLAVPRRSVLENEAGEYVRIPEGKTFREQPVTTGLRASDGMVEIISGISEGDVVITYIPESVTP